MRAMTKFLPIMFLLAVFVFTGCLDKETAKAASNEDTVKNTKTADDTDTPDTATEDGEKSDETKVDLSQPDGSDDSAAASTAEPPLSSVPQESVDSSKIDLETKVKGSQSDSLSSFVKEEGMLPDIMLGFAMNDPFGALDQEKTEKIVSYFEGRYPEKKVNEKSAVAIIIFNVSKEESDLIELCSTKLLDYYKENLLASADDKGFTNDDEREKWLNEKVKPDLISLLKDYKAVDVFIFGHGNSAHEYFLKDIPAELIGNMRLVYNSGCTDGQDAAKKSWIDQGAVSFVGHEKDRSLSPLFVLYFLENWLKGVKLKESVNNANKMVSKEFLLSAELKENTQASFSGNEEVSFNWYDDESAQP